MRTFVSLLLAVLLVACPYLCRADSFACCADHCEESGGPDDDKAPNPSPNEAESCVCAGAIKDSTQLSSPVDEAHGPVQDAYVLGITLPYHSPFDTSSRDGAPPGRSPTGSHRLHLLLQNFRC